VEGFLRLMATGDEVTGPINLGNPGEFTIRALAEKVIEMTGAASQIEFRPLPQDDPQQRQPNIEKAKAILDWEPTVHLEEGLRRTIAYFDQLLSSGAA
jgi:UDP-glucuronate decarboxylase